MTDTADHDAAAANQFAEKRAKYDTDCRDTRPADWNIANLARAYLERTARCSACNGTGMMRWLGRDDAGQIAAWIIEGNYQPTKGEIDSLARAYLERGEALQALTKRHHEATTYYETQLDEADATEKALREALENMRKMGHLALDGKADVAGMVLALHQADKALEMGAEGGTATRHTRLSVEPSTTDGRDAGTGNQPAPALESKPSPKWDIDEQHPDNRPLTEEQIRELKEYGID